MGKSKISVTKKFTKLSLKSVIVLENDIFQFLETRSVDLQDELLS